MRAKGTWIEKNGHALYRYDEPIPDSVYPKGEIQVFIVGTKGIPANYGGFETFADNLTKQKTTDKIHYHVACLGEEENCFEYNDATCFQINVSKKLKSARAVWYDIVALRRFVQYCKAHPSIVKPVFYVCACRIGPFIGWLKRQIRDVGGVLYVNPDGHEWKRAKWNAAIKRYWKLSERKMIKAADLVICDSKNIEDYIKEDYAAYQPKTTYIAYGADVTPSQLKDGDPDFCAWMSEHQLKKDGYYLVVGRFVPENNYETMLREFMASDTEKSLVVLTETSSKFYVELEEKTGFTKDPRIKFVGTVYDQQKLKKIREYAYGYLHGHEVGGTNPSLVEALGSTRLNLLLDVGFNREVGEGGALYWSKEPGSLAGLLQQVDCLSEQEKEMLSQKAKDRVKTAYSWAFIVSQYETLFLNSCQ